MNKLLYFIPAIVLSSCCTTTDNRVARGYPFDGETLELDYKEIRYYTYISGERNLFITDTNDAKVKLRKDAFELIKSINYDSFDIIYFERSSSPAYSGTFQTRLMINHISKKYWLETRGSFTHCYGGGQSNYISIAKLLRIPRLPDGYSWSF